MKLSVTEIHAKRIGTFNSGWNGPEEGINVDGVKLYLDDDALAALANCAWALQTDRAACRFVDEHDRHLACERAEPEEVA